LPPTERRPPARVGPGAARSAGPGKLSDRPIGVPEQVCRRKWAVSPLFLFVETVNVYRDIPEELRTLIEPIVDDAGFELVDAHLARGGRPWTLKVIIDTPECDGRVSVDSCAAVSRELGSQLDVADPIKAGYRLEVSSPGLDRPLTREKDFASACGRQVQVETRQPLSGRRRFRGVLVRFEAGVAAVDVDGHEVEIPFAEVSKANTVYQFSRADFVGRAG
jgi:ribosome maturation factor RimP